MTEDSTSTSGHRRSSRDRRRDKALLVGIQYSNPTHDEVDPLHNPHNDVDLFGHYLEEYEGYQPNNITVLVDQDDVSEETLPTKTNILRNIDALVKDARKGDRLIFVWHGCQTLNRSGTERDKRDEGVLTSDHSGFPVDEQNKLLPSDLSESEKYGKKIGGVILDNEFRRRLVDPIPPGCQLIAFFETCHSGTILDLDSRTPETRHFILISLVSSIRKSVTSGYRIVLNSPLLSPNLQPQRIKYGKKASNPSEEDREQSDLPVAAVPRSRMKVSAKKESAEIKHATVICFSSARDGQKSWDGKDKRTMLSIVVDRLREQAVSNSSQPSMTPQHLESHIRKHLNEDKIELAVPAALKKKPAVRKKLKRYGRLVRNICRVQIPTVTSFEGDKVLIQPLQL